MSAHTAWQVFIIDHDFTLTHEQVAQAIGSQQADRRDVGENQPQRPADLCVSVRIRLVPWHRVSAAWM